MYDHEKVNIPRSTKRFVSRTLTILREVETLALRVALTVIFLYGLLRVIQYFARK